MSAGATWSVPSQSQSAGAYVVNLLAATCSCPDYELRRKKCKHLWAVEMVTTVETAPDGSQVVTESINVTGKPYSQAWPQYNAAPSAPRRPPCRNPCATCATAS